MAADQNGSSARKRRVLGWCAVVVGLALLLLAFVPLEKADQAASVGSFFVGAVIAISGGLTATTGRRSDEAAGGPETWPVDQVIQVAGSDGYQAGRDNIDQRGSSHSYHGGISLAEFRRYQHSVEKPLQALVNKATHSYQRLEWKLRLTLRIGSFALICALVVGVVFGRQLSDSTPVTAQAEEQSRPTTQSTKVSMLADDVALENQVNKFFADYHAENRNGGFSNVEIIDRFFASSLKWYNDRPTRDHSAFAGKFVGRGKNTLDCALHAPVVTSVIDQGNEVQVDAVAAWISARKGTKGSIDVTYTLVRASKGQPFRISVVSEPRPQTKC